MTMRAVPRKRLHYGIAIDAHRFVALPEDPGRGEAFTHDLTPDWTAGRWPDLVRAFDQFHLLTQSLPVRASVSLMPSFVRVRTIELPYMRRGAIVDVLQRDASRFFFAVRDDQVVAVRHVTRSRNRRTVLAAAAPRWLIELIESQSSAVVQIHQIVPAHAAWAAAAASVKAPQRPVKWLGVPYGEALELLELRGSTVRQVRRVRSVGDEALVNRITGTLPAAITSLTREEPAIQIAARCANSASVLSLIAPSVQARERHRAGRQLLWLAATAATMFLSSELLGLVDINRELAHTQSAREAIRNEVADAMGVRNAVSTIERRLKLLCGIRELTPRWSDALVVRAGHLPLNAHLAEVSLSGDSLTLEGAADRASDVFEQLRQAPRVVALRATAPIRHETLSDQRTTELFSLMVRLATLEPRASRP
jgi:hypothetical protein